MGLHFSRSGYTEEYGESLAQSDFGSLEHTYYKLMLTGDYYWMIPRENLELYSGVPFGYGSFVERTTGELEEDDLVGQDRTGILAMHVKALGMRYRAIQVEDGFGFKELLAMGISLRLKVAFGGVVGVPKIGNHLGNALFVRRAVELWEPIPEFSIIHVIGLGELVVHLPDFA